jgi:hypothetical protein
LGPLSADMGTASPETSFLLDEHSALWELNDAVRRHPIPTRGPIS